MTSSNPFNPGYLTEHELRELGFKNVGENVRVAATSTIVGLENIEIGSNVRIDPYCSLIAAGNGYIRIGSYVHIAGYCGLYGGSGIVLEDFAGLSSKVSVYSGSDDYTGQFLTNPTVPERFLGITRGEVRFGRHAIVGAGTVILPRVDIAEGVAVGSQSLVTKSLEAWGIYSGCPVKRLKDRSRNLLKLESELLGGA